jgi:hypothetical protein
MYRKIILLLATLSGYASAHQFLPTYPTLERSYVQGVMKVEMEIFNSRKDVDYFQFDVYDDNWEEMPFATESRIVPVFYLERKQITIYIREEDKNQVRFFCSTSKIVDREKTETVIASRICSRVK